MILILGLFVTIILMLIVIVLFILQNNIVYRIQITAAFNTLVIIFISLLVYQMNKPEYIDIAILYALLSYISIIAISKYLTFQLANQEEE